MIIAGAFGGWRAGKPFEPYGLVGIRIFGAFLYGLLVLFLSGWFKIGLSDLQQLVTDYLVLVACGVVPFVFAGWLKQSRDRRDEVE